MPVIYMHIGETAMLYVILSHYLNAFIGEIIAIDVITIVRLILNRDIKPKLLACNNKIPGCILKSH